MNELIWSTFQRLFEADKQLQKDREALHHSEQDFDIDLCSIAFDLIGINPPDRLLDAWFDMDYEQVKYFCECMLTKETKRPNRPS